MREEVIGGQRLILGDCLEVLPTLAAGSVDAVITDPPYQLTLTSLTKRTLAFDTLRECEWLEDFRWMESATEAMKQGAAWYVWMNDEGWSLLKASAVALGLRPCNRLLWLKTNPLPSYQKTNYRNASEMAMYGTKGHITAYFASRLQQELLSYWFGPIVGGNERSIHPTQKPLELTMRWVDNSCPDGGTVLDPFLGSGTTLVAAELLGRRGIGIEISEEYFDIACRRVEEAVKKRQAQEEQLTLEEVPI